MDTVLYFIRQVRAVIMKALFPNRNYYLPIRSVNPLSRKFGYDRGTPIDRFYIEDFLDKNKHHIKGRCLEIVDNSYTLKFGDKNNLHSEVLDLDTKNPKATIYGNLKDLKGLIADNTYDCLVITQTFGMIDEYNEAIAECKRILKPGGVLLATAAVMSPVFELGTYYRFTPLGAKYVFGKHFDKLEVGSYGNALAGQCFWVGMAQEELKKEEIEYNDPQFPMIVTIKATK